MKNLATLIIGANSKIAKSIAKQVIADNRSQLIVVSRDTAVFKNKQFDQAIVIAIDDYQEQQIKSAIANIRNSFSGEISRVFICNGVLHNKHCQPEKRLEDFSIDAFTRIVTANTATPMLWLKNLVPLVVGKQECKLVIFSARVGSISDNQLGGWYSYRASKAAMNMMLKSAAVELARRAKNIKLISFHPGTTDTPLSKPFQKNVPEGKLFTSDFVANQLFHIIEEIPVDGLASFIDWEGKIIPW